MNFAAARDAVGEEPIAAGGWHQDEHFSPLNNMKVYLPPLVTLPGEEPIATGGARF